MQSGSEPPTHAHLAVRKDAGQRDARPLAEQSPHTPPGRCLTWLYAKTPDSAMPVPTAFCVLTGLLKKKTAATMTTTRLTPERERATAQ